MLQSWTDVFVRSFEGVWYGVAQYLPNILVAILIFILGWILGALIGQGLKTLINTLKVNDVLRGTDVDQMVGRAGYTLDVGALIGWLIKWFVIIVFLLAALDVLGLTQVTIFLNDVVVNYIPQVIVAVLVLIVAAVLGDFLNRVVTGAATAAGLKHATLLGSVTRWAIWIFAILAALYHLGIAAPFVQTLFTGVIIALSLAIGLSFGLGGQDAARDYIAKIRRKIPEDNA